ncbi:putative lipid II flippase FtsW [Microbacterium paludicola]|uniref:Probable peptidoglycan glycosyltransferase FtsW n=1 Tax=Microbacterium paludicola TaxID=300019 RepID=A0A4Y9FXN6_9MICO|nr:putative lipid II flippase FtsW [Microbacterium paludicola]TFU34168.1 putative lipid II flippase FtsW [Microbacterium paludicola]
MSTTTTRTPKARATPEKQEPRSGALTARVSLGRVFAPVPLEFLLIASTALLLTGFGVVMVTSATTASALSRGESPYNDGMQQAMFALLGLSMMFVVSRLPVRFFRRIGWVALGLALVVQLLVFTPLGVEVYGNRNWLRIAGFSLQPSELLKLSLALWAGMILYRKRNLLSKWQHVFIPLVPVSMLAIGTVLAGKDLGTSMVLVLILLACLFFSGVKLRIFVLPVIAGALVVAALAITSPNRMGRIMSFLDPDCDYIKECYQPLHGIWSLAGGGIFGRGLGNSIEKYNWLPAAGDDYIFAIVGEELGLIGCIVVLLLFATFAVGAFRIIRNSDDPFVKIAAGGITVWILGQALINIGVVLRVFPVLGVPLPFLSAGGSSLVAVLAACGVLLAFCRTLPDPSQVAMRRPGAARGATNTPGSAKRRPARPNHPRAGR